MRPCAARCRTLRHVLQVQPRDCGVVLTEPYLNLPALREAALQVRAGWGRGSELVSSRLFAACAVCNRRVQ